MADNNENEGGSRKHSKRNSLLSLRHSRSKKSKPCDPDEDPQTAESALSGLEEDEQNDFISIQQIELINLDRERKRDLVYNRSRTAAPPAVGTFQELLASARLLEQAQLSQQSPIKKPCFSKTVNAGFQALSDQVDYPTASDIGPTQIPISTTHLDRICNVADLAQTHEWDVSPISKQPPPKDLSTKEAILEDFGVNSPSPLRPRTQEFIRSPTPVLKTVVLKTYLRRSAKRNTSTPNRRLFDNEPSAYSSDRDRITDSEEDSDNPELFHSLPDTRIAVNRSPVPDPNLSGGVLGNIMNLSFYYSQTECLNTNDLNIDTKTKEDVEDKSPPRGDPSSVLSDDEREPFHGFSQSITLQPNFDDRRLLDFSSDVPSDEEIPKEDVKYENIATPSKDLTSFLQDDEDLFANFMSPIKQTDGDSKTEWSGEVGVGIVCRTHDGSSPKFPLQFNGFSTGLGSKISVSNTAIANDSTIFDDPHPAKQAVSHPKINVSNAMLPTLSGFSTGRGAVIRVPENPAKRKANIFDDFDMQLHPIDDANDVQPIKVACLQSGQATISRINQLSGLETSTAKLTTPAFQGFSTGRGAAIQVTKNTKPSIFSDFDLQLIPIIEDQDVLNNKSTKLPLVDSTSKQTLPPSKLNGFSTGRGTAITVTLGAKTNLFDDFDMQLIPVEDNNDNRIQETANNPASFTGFKTGNGSNIKVSNAAADKMRNIFDDISMENVDDEESTIAVGETSIVDKVRPLKLNTSISFFENSDVKSLNTSTSTPKLPAPHPTFDSLNNRSRKLVVEESIHTPIRNPHHNPNESKTPAHFLHTPVNQDPFLHSFTQEITASTKALLEDELMSESCPFFHQIPSKSRSLNVKPTRLFSRFDECTTTSPEKSQPTSNPSLVPNEVRMARRTARIEQERAILDKNHVKMRPGALYLKKLVSAQSKWNAFVDKQKPYTAPSPFVSKEILELTAENVNNFRLSVTCPNDSFVIDLTDGVTIIPDDHDQIGISEMCSAFLSCSSIDPKLLHADWLSHHLSLIILKLAAMERSFPQTLGEGRTLNVENVMLQLKFRYDKEIDRAERSILRKVLEKDDVSTRRMVLYVEKILSERECELSDGHYGVRTVLDQEMERLFKKNVVKVGTKLMVSGAELIGLDDGCFPLDVPASVCLRISANSTRRVRWFTKLGACQDSSPFTISLGSVLSMGGRITRLNLCIIRIYAMLFVDNTKNEGSGTALRSERVQKRLEGQNHIQLELIEKLYSQISHEFDKEEEENRRSRIRTEQRITDLTDASQLFDILQNANDPEAIEDQMTTAQKQQLRDFQTKQIDLRTDLINQRVRERISADATKRKVSQLLKVKVINAAQPTITAMLSVWSPHESLVEMLCENQVVQLCNASASGIRYSELHISAGRNSKFQRLPDSRIVGQEELQRRVTNISSIGEPNFKPIFNELDTVGLVVKIGQSNSRKFQPAFLVDESLNVMCVNFWAGLKSFAYDDLVTVGAVLAVRDLQWRTISSVQTIPSTFATEFTTFTEHPKSTELAQRLNALCEFVSAHDKTSLIEQSLIKIESLKSAPKPNASTVFSPKTPLQSRNAPRSLDTSTANGLLQTPVEFSPGVGQLIASVQRRIDKLSTYGEAPPLSPLVLNTSTSINKKLGKGHRKRNSSEDHLPRQYT